MIRQALVYQLRLFTLFNLNIQVNALILIVLFLISFLLMDKYKVFKIISYITYLLLLIGITNLFIYFPGNNELLNTRLSGYPFFWYAIIHFRSSAFVTFQVVFGLLNILIFFFFPFLFKKVRYFIFTLLLILLVSLLSHISGISHRTIFLVDYLYFITGYILAYILKHLKMISYFIDYLIKRV